jgi:hypothetical protein
MAEVAELPAVWAVLYRIRKIIVMFLPLLIGLDLLP